MFHQSPFAFLPAVVASIRISLSIYVTTRNGNIYVSSAYPERWRPRLSLLTAAVQGKIIPLGQWVPKVAADAYVAPNFVFGRQVTVNDGASVWDGCVLGGDLNKNTVGFCSILQERCVIHAAWFSTAGKSFGAL
ncbi:hypothetical protein Gohar_012212 [Gossypium harknessii]|uniref:Uncharacterized protein n=1 Tax=Gossypium harknessii TaxID=34285 RepID=A0A7J9GWD5_9ROSI|nr:hypothetical protein [Gossypium harknessii]